MVAAPFGAGAGDVMWLSIKRRDKAPVHDWRELQAVTAACASLAEQMVADAEGATKLVRVHVTGARSDAVARTAARRPAVPDEGADLDLEPLHAQGHRDRIALVGLRCFGRDTESACRHVAELASVRASRYAEIARDVAADSRVPSALRAHVALLRPTPRETQRGRKHACQRSGN